MIHFCIDIITFICKIAYIKLMEFLDRPYTVKLINCVHL